MSTTIHKKTNFFEWIVKHGISKDELMKMNDDKKLKILLRWKYGSLLDAPNEECYHTDNYLNRIVADEQIEQMEGEKKEFWNLHRNFESIFFNLKKQIGLVNIEDNFKDKQPQYLIDLNQKLRADIDD